MDRELFADWFCKVFVPNCGRERPVLLVMDNHDSHISVPVIEKAQAEDIVLVGLPSHTTHLLQPLDVKVYNVAINLKHILFFKGNHIFHTQIFYGQHFSVKLYCVSWFVL